MAQMDLYFKVEIDQDPEEKLERLVTEIERQLRRVYGVRAVEFSHAVSRSEDSGWNGPGS